MQFFTGYVYRTSSDTSEAEVSIGARRSREKEAGRASRRQRTGQRNRGHKDREISRTHHPRNHEKNLSPNARALLVVREVYCF